ncbi:hypothetical protein [Methylomonas rapida]|uniref:Uncharacterized protein n=1 Tax=Methylomonas rapida TaxID=2963939 RepID=A0ABY7GKK9_9GAMM|nr:hypothetical protein [Methylomonas rapida]WAR45045.1 hypothetical protein NM686_000620 [Methylomonas rapida]
MNTQPLNQAKDEDARQVEIALRRAAQKARQLAAQTDTPLVVVRNGQLLVEHVTAQDTMDALRLSTLRTVDSR